jgi:uncharacterized protein (TIGR03083 family)
MTDVTTARASIDGETAWSLELLRAIDEWTAPTRLPGWSVADLGAHLAWGQALQADAWRKLAAGDASTAGAPEVPATDRGAVVDALVAANARLSAALAAVSEEQVASGVCAMPYGSLPAGLVLLLATLEAGVHRSDLAAAAGEDDALADDTVAAAAVVFGATIPMLGAAGDGSAPEGTSVVLRAPGVDLAAVRTAEGWVAEAPQGEPTTVVSGSPSDVVLFALGRRGADVMDVVGDRTGAERFKAWFPGP